MRTISQIIDDAGGPQRIKEAASKLTADAVRKWRSFGVPDRHWPILIDLAGATPAELYEANRIARLQSAKDDEQTPELTQ